MPTTTGITDWGVATWSAFAAGMAGFFTWLPNLVGALLILLIGWGVASLLYTLTDKLLDAVRFDALMHRARIDEAISRSGVRIDPSNLLATLVKWTVLLVAFMMAAENLGLTQVSMGISAILGMLFAIIYRAVFNMPSSWGFPILYGFIYGIVIWFVSSRILAGEPVSGLNNTPSFIVQHLVFGVITGLSFGMLRPARAYLPRYQ